MRRVLDAATPHYWKYFVFLALAAAICAATHADSLQHAGKANRLVERRELHGGPGDGGSGPRGGPLGPGGGPGEDGNSGIYPFYFPGSGAAGGSDTVPVATVSANSGPAGGSGAAGYPNQASAGSAGAPAPAPAQPRAQSTATPDQALPATTGSPSCDINGPNCCADNGLNSRLVPVTSNATLPTLSAVFFSTVPAGGGFIATPVNSLGGLASSGQIRVNQTLAAAPQAFLNATINLNRPAAARGPGYVYVAGSQICIPNFFSAQTAARAASTSQAAPAAGAQPASSTAAASDGGQPAAASAAAQGSASPAATAAFSTPASVATPIAAAGN